MMQETDIFPIQDCEDCLHTTVCKYIEMFKDMKAKKLLPIDFETASCVEYLPSDYTMECCGGQDDFDTAHYASASEGVRKALSEAVDHLLNMGFIPGKVHMNSNTMLLFSTAGAVKYIDVSSVRLEVFEDNSVPDGDLCVYCKGDEE